MKVVLLRGVSGSGKSTYAKKLSEQYVHAVICSADDGMINNQGEYDFKPFKLPMAHQQCFRKFVNVIDVKRAGLVIVDNTNTQLHEIAPYLKYAELHDIPVEIVKCTCSFTEATERNVHGVPENTILSMANRMEKLPRYWPKETVIDTSNK